MAITVAMRTTVSQLYVSLFGRAPDGEGLGFWVGQLDAGKTMAQVADMMYATTPARAYYPTFLTNAEIISSFYKNVFGVTTDTEGEAHWTAKLNGGESAGSVISQIIAAALANTNASGATAKATLENKIAVAQWYGEQNGSVAGATSILAGVTSDVATVAAAKAGSAQSGQTFTLTTGVDTVTGTSGNDTIIGDAATITTSDQVNAGTGTDTVKIYDLAAATDVPTMTGVEVVELINANAPANLDLTGITELTSLVLDNTTTTDDYLIGSAVKATVKTMVAGESVTLTSRATDTTADLTVAALDAADAGTVTVNFDGASIATVNLTSSGSTKNNLTFASTGSEATINVDGSAELVLVNGATTITTFNAASSTGGVTFDMSAATGANQTVTGGSGNDTLTVDLARNITLDAGAGNDVVAFDAGTVLGDLSSTTGAADSIKGGDGTDTLSMTAATADSLDGDTAADRAVITGFERIRISDDLNNVTVNAAQFSGGVNYVQLGADTTTANGTITGVTSGATIENRAAVHAGSTITIAAAGDGQLLAGDIVTATIRGTTVSYTLLAGDVAGNAAADVLGASTGLAAAINTQFGAGTATNALGVVTLATTVATAVTENSADAGVTIVAAAGDAIETDITMTGATGAGTPDDLLNIVLNGNITNNDNVESAYGVAGINKLVISTADRVNTDAATDRNDGYIVNLTNDNNVTQITANGDRALAFTSTNSTAALATFDAASLSGDLAINLTTNGLTQGVTVTGGSGTNTIVATGFADIITGGARADTITAGAGADKITGGAGADTFVFAASSSGGVPSATVFDEITDFAKASDIIDFGAQALSLSTTAASTAAVGTAAINAEGLATFNAADDTLAEKIAAVNAGLLAGTEATGQVAIFEHDGSSYLYVYDDTADTVDAADVLIKLTGVTGLTDSTISGGDLTIA